MIQNPTMDPDTFARQFARIKARDAELARKTEQTPKETSCTQLPTTP